MFSFCIVLLLSSLQSGTQLFHLLWFTVGLLSALKVATLVRSRTADAKQGLLRKRKPQENKQTNKTPQKFAQSTHHACGRRHCCGYCWWTAMAVPGLPVLGLRLHACRCPDHRRWKSPLIYSFSFPPASFKVYFSSAQRSCHRRRRSQLI
jgi:hypothetical protein